MKPKDLLRELIDTRYNGNQAAFSRAIKRQPAQVNQWLTGYRKLDTKGQRHIETELGLRAGYMSGELDYSATPPESTLGVKEPTPHHTRPLVQQVREIAERIDDVGLLKLQGYAACLLTDHPLVKAKPPLLA